MPGRRNLARERAQHRIDSPARQAAIYQLLHERLPHSEVALIGQTQILLYLSHLGVRRRNSGPLTWRMLERWRRSEGCPILRGVRAPSYSGAPITTSFALTSWLLTRFDSYDLFRVVYPLEVDHAGSFPTTQASDTERTLVRCTHAA